MWGMCCSVSRVLWWCRDAQHGEKEGDPKPRYDDSMAEDWVEYIKMDTSPNIYRALNKMWAHQPVLMRGAPLVAGLVGRWSMQQLVGVLLAGLAAGKCALWQGEP